MAPAIKFDCVALDCPDPYRLARFYARMRSEGYPPAFVLVMCALYTTARLGLAAHLSPELGRLLRRAPTAFEAFARDYAGAWRAA